MKRFCDNGWIIVASLLLVAGFAGAPRAEDPQPFSARAGLDLARDAALTWAGDAVLTYLENDESVWPDGTSMRWGYVFYSESKGAARGYTVRDGKILEASDLGFDFEAPPISDEWVDSGKALLAAEKKAGQKYRTEHGGRLSNMLLIRGAFDQKHPDTSTWALIYTSEGAPSLLVVVEAADGKVVRTWRG